MEASYRDGILHQHLAVGSIFSLSFSYLLNKQTNRIVLKTVQLASYYIGSL